MCSLGTQSRCLAAAGRGGPPSPARKDHLESFMQQIPDWESLCEHKSIKFIRSPTSMLFQQVTWICKRINNLLDPQNGPQRKCKIVKVFQTRTKSLKKSKNRIKKTVICSRWLKPPTSYTMYKNCEKKKWTNPPQVVKMVHLRACMRMAATTWSPPNPAVFSHEKTKKAVINW